MADFQLPPQYAPRDVERGLYRRWVDRGAFAPSPDPRREPYVIVIPPPNVTAVLHMGQGLNNVTQDVLIRFERMRGRAALWLPGTDHAGIATQNVVERIIASEVETALALARDDPLHHVLRRDACVVGPREPQRSAAPHALEPDEHVLGHVVEPLAHVQHGRHVGRWDHDDVRLAPRVRAR